MALPVTSESPEYCSYAPATVVIPGKHVIGITGGIGSGKSVISRILRLNGFPVYDCDSEAKRLMENSESVRSSLCRILGNDIYSSECRLDRKRVATMIFSDSNLLQQVNSLVHSALRNDFINFARCVHSSVVFCESAILMSSGLGSICSHIWLIEASEGIRIERVAQRNGMSEDEIRSRMDVQNREFDMMPSQNVVYLLNDGSIGLLPIVVSLAFKDSRHDIKMEIYEMNSKY